MALLVGLLPQEAPGLATAFNEGLIRGYLQAALFGTDHPKYTVECCTPTGSLYIPGECCVVQYQLEARNSTSGEVLEPIVMGRVFPNQATCAAYMRDKLAVLAARMRNRPEVAPFAAPAAMIEPLNMVVHVWPIDGELPTLVDATDRQRMIEVFRETLPEALEQQFVVKDCHIERVSYRRRPRCVLRYTITGKAAGSDEFRIVYGKITALGNEPLKSRMIDALRDQIVQRGARGRFIVPRSFWRPDLQLLLLEALPGEAQIGPALAARLRGKPPPGALSLEEMIATCGYVAAMLHTSGLQPGRVLTFHDELADLRREIAMIRQFVPAFSDRAQSWLQRIAALAEQSEPLQLCVNHGDFHYAQLLFSGTSSGLVDFDTMCLAEPALDVGKFLACLRAQVQKIHKRASVPSRLGEELAEQFLRAYIGARGEGLENERQLRLRATLYENIAFVRMAVRSQQKLNESRLERMTALLEQRMS